MLGRPGAMRVDDPWELLDQVTESGAEGAGAAVIGTPDDLIAAIETCSRSPAGSVWCSASPHDWANRENTRRSWDLVARYVMPP